MGAVRRGGGGVMFNAGGGGGDPRLSEGESESVFSAARVHWHSIGTLRMLFHTLRMLHTLTLQALAS
jgi:hypothetical protein